MDILSESTGEAWEKLGTALLKFAERTKVNNTPVAEIRWLSIHVNRPLKEPRISVKFDDFCKRTKLGENSKPKAYFLQVTGNVREGYWWKVYGKPIWEQMPKIEKMLKQDPSYNKPSIVLRDSKKHLGVRDTPCLVYLTFLIRDGKLELGVHFDTNALQYVQGNMYGLSELQKIIARTLKVEVGTYNHHCDSLFVNEKHLGSLTKTMRVG